MLAPSSWKGDDDPSFTPARAGRSFSAALVMTSACLGDLIADADAARQLLLADLAAPHLRDAVELYFQPGQPFAGLTFDSLGNNPPNAITSDDLLAVTLLDVRWPPRAVRSVLELQAAQIGELLGNIDNNVDLWEPTAGDELLQVDPLWEVLCALPGVRDTRASKLLARKRPRLVPITDSVVVSAVGTPGRTWWTLHRCFQDERFRGSVAAVRPANANEEDTSLLRIFDVAIWMLYSQSRAARTVRLQAGVTPPRRLPLKRPTGPNVTQTTCVM
jgi:Family of unknown function (DUF6308)